MTAADLSQAKGLMVFLANFEPQHQQAYRQWHNAEHVPERVGIPGFLLGRRYLAADDATRFLMCYDTLGEQVLVSDAYLHALNHPTPWTREALTWFRNPDRNVYTLRASWGAAAPSASPVLAVARFDAGALDAAALPAGVARSALYGLDSAGSSVRTQEAGIHGARSAMDGGLLWLECSDVLLLREPDRRQALQAWAAALPLQGLQPLQLFCIDFAYAAR
jgi:hypothetical protein